MVFPVFRCIGFPAPYRVPSNEVFKSIHTNKRIIRCAKSTVRFNETVQGWYLIGNLMPSVINLRHIHIIIMKKNGWM